MCVRAQTAHPGWFCACVFVGQCVGQSRAHLSYCVAARECAFQGVCLCETCCVACQRYCVACERYCVACMAARECAFQGACLCETYCLSCALCVATARDRRYASALEWRFLDKEEEEEGGGCSAAQLQPAGRSRWRCSQAGGMHHVSLHTAIRWVWLSGCVTFTQ